MQNVLNYTVQGGATTVIGGTLQFGGTASAGIYGGGGTTASPLSYAMPGKFLEFITENSAASGDSRGLYWRHYLAGAGAQGEAGRFYTTVTGAGAVSAHGIHASCSFSGSGTCTGQAQAVRATLHIPDATLGGTTGALNAEVYADGSSSNASNAQFIRCVLGGDSSGVATLNGSAALLSIEGITIGSAGDGKVVDAISGDKAVTHLAKIRINGTAYYIMLRNAV